MTKKQAPKDRPYERTVKRMAATLRDALLRWEAAMVGHVEVDEIGTKIGTEVCSNLKADGAFTVSSMRAFVEDLLARSTAAMAASDPDALSDAFRHSCYANQRLGQVSRGVRELMHVIPEDSLRVAINTANCEPASAIGGVWRRFLDAYANSDYATLTSILLGVPLNSKGHQIFCTRPHPAKYLPTWANIDTWDATTACAALGLSKMWTGYRANDRLWLLHYGPGAKVRIHVPTSADADWRAIFRPSRSRRTRYGWSIPLGPVRQQIAATGRHALGMPELIHESQVFSLGGPDVTSFIAARNLGVHAGW